MRKPETKSNPAPASASAPVMARSRFPVWLMAALLALVTIALYWPAMRCDFVNFDDPDYVTENPHVQGGLNWAGVKWAFGNTEQAAYWAPMMWLSHMLACQLFGLNPWGHHLINVLLHAVNTVLVFLLFRRLTGSDLAKPDGGGVVWVASAAGGIGGVGHGAQGRVEHVLRSAGAAVLCALRARTVEGSSVRREAPTSIFDSRPSMLTIGWLCSFSRWA